MPRPLPKWVIPMSDGYAPVLVTIRDTVVPPCVHVDLALPGRLLTPLESTQLGLAMQEAGRVAGQLWAAQLDRARAVTGTSSMKRKKRA